MSNTVPLGADHRPPTAANRQEGNSHLSNTSLNATVSSTAAHASPAAPQMSRGAAATGLSSIGEAAASAATAGASGAGQGTTDEAATEVSTAGQEAARAEQECSAEAARAGQQGAGTWTQGQEQQHEDLYGDLLDKPGHLATAEQCRLANGGVCWHLLQMAVKARAIAQRTNDSSVSCIDLSMRQMS